MANSPGASAASLILSSFSAAVDLASIGRNVANVVLARSPAPQRVQWLTNELIFLNRLSDTQESLHGHVPRDEIDSVINKIDNFIKRQSLHKWASASISEIEYRSLREESQHIKEGLILDLMVCLISTGIFYN